MNKTIPPQIIRQIFTILIILLLGGLIFSKLLPYFSGILGAITLYVVLQKWMTTLIEKKKWKSSRAALLLMLGSFICFLLPVGGIAYLLGNKIGKIAKNSEEVVEGVKAQFSKLEDAVGFDLHSKLDASAISEGLSTQLQQWLGNTADAIVSVALMYFLLYFMLVNQKKLKDSLSMYIPMNRSNIVEIGEGARKMVRTNAIGIPLVGIAKGIVGLIGFFIFGIKDPFFWFAILSVVAMIPLVGTIMGILPVFFVTLSTQDAFSAWGILIYGLVVVAMTDNILRLYMLKRLDDVHPLITLIGVLIGVPLFGFIGLIFGPLLISLFLIIMKIYKEEYANTETEVTGDGL